MSGGGGSRRSCSRSVSFRRSIRLDPLVSNTLACLRGVPVAAGHAGARGRDVCRHHARGGRARRCTQRHRRRSGADADAATIPGLARHPRSHRSRRQSVEGRRRGTGVSRLSAIEYSTAAAMARGSRRGYRKICCRSCRWFNGESLDALEDTLLAGMAGVSPQPHPIASSSGKAVAIASMPHAPKRLRLRRVRHRQGGPSLQAALQTRAAAAEGRRRRARAGRHADVDPLRGVPRRSAGPGDGRRECRAAARAWRDRRHGAARRVAAADRRAHEQGLARHRIAPRPRRRRWRACRCGGSIRQRSCRRNRRWFRRSGRRRR